MSDIQIVTDSTSDLGEALIKQHHIQVVPLRVVFGQNDYRDGIDLSAAELYAKVKQSGVLPQTTAPSPADFLSVFQPIVESGRKVLYIGLSSRLSSTCQNALIAAGELPEGRVEVVDSLNLSTGIGLLVLQAADAIRGGCEDLIGLANQIRQDVPRVKTEFVIDTLDYLHKGGRCSGTQKWMGSLLRIHPVIHVEQGGMVMVDKLRGTMAKVAESLLARALNHPEIKDAKRIFVTHSEAPSIAAWLQQELRRELPSQEIGITDAGCVISSHCGPGTIGILYL